MFKVVLLGEAGVGKSSIFLRLKENVFGESLQPTVGIESCSKVVKIDGQSITVSIKLLLLCTCISRNTSTYLMIVQQASYFTRPTYVYFLITFFICSKSFQSGILRGRRDSKPSPGTTTVTRTQCCWSTAVTTPRLYTISPSGQRTVHNMLQMASLLVLQDPPITRLLVIALQTQKLAVSSMSL